MATNNLQNNTTRQLLKKVTCPHCWEVFDLSEICWIARSDELVGDILLGDEEHERFLPSRFDVDGNAIDRMGAVCHELACPRCHLKLPDSVLLMRPFFVSIVGAPASGKSYFLASMTYQMLQTFPKKFFIDVADADPLMNQRLADYVSLQFMNDDRGSVVKINKTEEQGDLYNTTSNREGERITYPQPFIFSLMPLPGHRYEEQRQMVATSLCLYDNAGESYLPKEGSSKQPVTQHLGTSHCIFFLFDPLQDHRLRELCRKVSNDPQLGEGNTADFRRSPFRQEQVLSEMIKRTRHLRNLDATKKYQQQVIVIVTKADAWHQLVPDLPYREKLWTRDPNTNRRTLYEQSIQKVSQITRDFLNKHIPQIVSNVESFASNVTYIPVSATGGSPTVDKQTQVSGFKASGLNPAWVEIPLLYALAKSRQGIISIR